MSRRTIDCLQERELAPRGMKYAGELQNHLDRLERLEWLLNLAPWAVMGTFTFRPRPRQSKRWNSAIDEATGEVWGWTDPEKESETGMQSAMKCFTKFMRRRLPTVSYVMALECNPSRDGYHVHSLWADCEHVYRRTIHSLWIDLHGFNRILPVKSVGKAVEYATKYLLKHDCWFDVRLQRWRVEKLNQTGPSALTLESPKPENL